MFGSIRGRLWLSYAALVAVALAIISVILTVFLLRNPYLYRQASVRLLAAESVLLRDPRSAGRIDLIADALDVRVLMISATGSVISDTDPYEVTLQKPLPGQRSRNVAVGRDVNGKAWLYTSSNLPDGNWLLIATPRPRILPALDLLKDELWRPMVQAAAIALLLALIFAYWLAGWIADPLQELIGAARGVAARRTRKAAIVQCAPPASEGAEKMPHVVERGPEEVRELARAFNGMLARVEASQRSQKDFVANVSHELKTPLTSIQGFAQAIIDGTADSPEACEQAALVIHEEAARMHRLAVDLLDLARLDAGTAEWSHAPVDVRSVLLALETRIRPMALSKGIVLDVSKAEGPLVVVGDGDRLAQVFSNLVDNALKFTQRGGQVSMKADMDNGQVRVAICDTGRGILPEDIPHIFDRFYQADTARGGGTEHGAGLGLAIAREVTEAHGGRIIVRSAVGQGTEFVVYLPSLDDGRQQHDAAR
jgi:signal transduction histidine kinase